MCFGATCGTCSKKSWRGCGQHIPQALSGVPESEWCTCEPRVNVNGKDYPPAAKAAMPGIPNIIKGWMGGSEKKDEKKDGGKEEL